MNAVPDQRELVGAFKKMPYACRCVRHFFIALLYALACCKRGRLLQSYAAALAGM